jgi:hypothetical protein
MPWKECHVMDEGLRLCPPAQECGIQTLCVLLTVQLQLLA